MSVFRVLQKLAASAADFILKVVRWKFAAALFSGLPLSANAEPGTFARCYGEITELEFPASHSGGVTTRMNVPSKNLAIVRLIESGSLYEDSPCHQEPLEVRSIVGSFVNIPLGNETADQLAANGVYPWFFRLSPDSPNSGSHEEAARLSMVDELGFDQPGGLRIVFNQSDPSELALVRLPLGYTSPKGRPLVMRCNSWRGFCDVTYTMRPGFWLRYDILNVAELRFTAQWGEIDRGVQSTLLSWIEVD